MKGMSWARTASTDRCNALNRQIEIIDRLGAVAARILNRTAGEANLDREPDCFSGLLRRLSKAIFKVRRNRKVGCLNNGLRVRQRFFTTGSSITAAKRKCQSGTCRGQGFKAQLCQDFRRARIPGIGNDKSPGPCVQGAECHCFLFLV